MPRLLERLGKLKGRSIDELRERSTQAARARLERFGLAPGKREPSDTAFLQLFDTGGMAGHGSPGDRLLECFRQRAQDEARFLPGLRDVAATAQALSRRCPQAARAAIAAAERICQGELALGGRAVRITTPPDWMTEPVSGKRVPALHWSRISYLDPDVAGDCKFTWELNRHQYFTTLGQAYALTKDERYAALFASHLRSWIKENPPKIGINWTSSLELALRAIAWTWAFYLFRDSPSLTGELFLRSLKHLYVHARHIENNLSTYFSPNTHLTGETLGLLYIGSAFPEFKRAPHWRALGKRILIEQLERQLLPDGVYFEQSTYYHRYTADFYLHAVLLTRASRDPLESRVLPTLDKLLDYLVHITRPDGTSPLIGDDDGGRLIPLDERGPNDFRDTVALGATVLQRPDCAYVAGNSTEGLIWLLGPDGLRAYDKLTPQPPACRSRAFAASGHFVLRGNWDRDADWAMVRCGPHGALAHAHADALAIEMAIAGTPLLVDPGTYTYTGSRAEREYFRGTSAHSTATIDELPSSVPGSTVFNWKSVAQSRVSSWVSHPTLDFFAGEHDGYLRLASPAVHSRAVFFLKGEYWVIRDRARSKGIHRLAIRLHWAPGTRVRHGDGGVFVAHTGGQAKALKVDGRIFSNSGQLSFEDAWCSIAYGSRMPSPVSVFSTVTDGAAEILTLLANSSAGLQPPECSSLRMANGAHLLTIRTTVARDTIFTGPTVDDEPFLNGIRSDASWTWLRHSLAGELRAFALVEGRNLIVGDDTLFRAAEVVEYAVGRRDGDRWVLDAPASTPAETLAVRSDSGIKELCVESAE